MLKGEKFCMNCQSQFRAQYRIFAVWYNGALIFFSKEVSNFDLLAFFLTKNEKKERPCYYHMQTANPISACTSTQSDKGLHSLLTKSLDTRECMNGELRPRLHFAYAQDDLRILSFAHVRSYFLHLTWPIWVYWVLSVMLNKSRCHVHF